MDPDVHLPQHSLSRRSSSSSALDLTGTPAGIASSAPSSPSLDSSRKRTGWVKVDAEQDPLQPSLSPEPVVFNSDNPLYSPFNEANPPVRGFSPYSSSIYSENRDRTESRARLSTTSLISPNDDDPERSSGRIVRYDVTSSPLKRTGTAIRSVGNNLRRVSLRVVNLAGAGLEDHLRLPEDDSGEKYNADEPFDLSKRLPIRGRTLCFLGPTSGVRLFLFKLLTFSWTEPIILVLILLNAIVLTIQAAGSLSLSAEEDNPSPPRIQGYFHTWEDYTLFVLFIIFTIEAFARICVSGFIFDPEVSAFSIFTSPFSDASSTPPNANSTPNAASGASPRSSRNPSIRKRVSDLRRNLWQPFRLNPRPSNIYYTSTETNPSRVDIPHVHHPNAPSTYLSSAMHSADHKDDTISLPFRLNIAQAQSNLERNLPYLRQSWNRIDFVAIVSFWITFVLASLGKERMGSDGHIGMFRALSVLRTARLLAITSGTTTIMHSLKTARPLLANVAYFVLFAVVLFSVIGIQSFKGSLRRTCFVSIDGAEEEIELEQFCGGYIDPVSLNETSYINLNGESAISSVKGYVCPLGQVCREGGNPHQGIQSFDTIVHAALQVAVIATINGWTPLMYSMIDSEFFVSSVYFIVCVVVLNFWLINLFVAVITNTFSAIRKETKKSAFGAASLAPLEDEQDEGWAGHKPPTTKKNLAKVIYTYTRWFWVLLALASLILQATRTDTVSATHETIMSYGELGFTIAFDVEIIIRFLATLPDWRSFFYHADNMLDLVLAIGSSVIQIPAIHESEVYPWLTVFQLMRFYRVILEVPRMRPLLLAVFGNMYGLVNMSLFVLLFNYLAALIAVQMLRGDLTDDVNLNFKELFNGFLAIWQIFSSEDWTSIMYDSAEAEIPLGQTVIVIIFMTGWMLFSNFIVLQMFIAVINENFDVAEEAKRGKQAKSYWENHQIQQGRSTWMKKLNPYRWFKANPVNVKVEHLPSNLVLPMQKTLVQDYTVSAQTGSAGSIRSIGGSLRKARHYPSKSLTALRKLFAGKEGTDDVPLVSLKHARNETVDLQDEETERHLELLASINAQTATSTEGLTDAVRERRAQKADFIRDHPTYDKTFWIFSHKNIIRRACQRLVQPARGERIFGSPPSPIALPIFQLLILLCVIGGITVESIATPTYRRQFYMENGLIRIGWFDIAESIFAGILMVEFLIKIIADGLMFTPNAYLRSIWNIFDFFILIGLIINVSTSIIFIGGLNRFTRSLKALRVLRLITLMDIMRTTFQSLLISGAMRIVDAAILAMLYMIPYAVWGLNIFAGKMNQCNDGDVDGISDCVNEYTNTVIDDSVGFLVPRVWDNPSPSTVFSFDTFRASLLILFEIVSLEGWIDVMNTAMGIRGVGLQPGTNVSQANALFFIVYNLMGGVVILTLFVSIIIGNFSAKTGTAFLTKPQREWIDLQKLFKRQRPSRRPKHKPKWPLRAWCFDRAVNKHGWWARSMTFLILVHVIALMTQTFTSQNFGDTFRNSFFLGITFVYIIDVVIRFVGLGYASFVANGWNVFDVMVSFGSFGTTLLVRIRDFGYVVEQLQKLFLVSIAFKLVQRSNHLNKLFKTAVASLPTIVSLLGLWAILFLFFAIMFVEVFGLTKWDSGETRTMNYSTVSSAMVMLAFMCAGEAWNQYMHDYTLTYPRCTNLATESDCGSPGWAFFLFIAWNVLSMYIFVNMFTGVVVENFSYVYQTTAGGAKSITREEMRAFKKVWAELANPKTGYLERTNFVPFFGKLIGVFEVRIYPVEYSIPSILAAAKETTKAEYSYDSPPLFEAGINLDKLNRILDRIDFSSIRRRRAIYTRLYHEASISHSQGRGISFSDMLMLLAHHKLIIDREALDLKDLVIRTETNRLVADLVNLDRVRSLLKMLSHRRRFLAHMEQKRQAEIGRQGIPSIVLDSLPIPMTPPTSSRDISSLAFDSPGGSSPNTPASARRSGGEALGSPLQRGRRFSDISMLSTSDIGFKSPRGSISEEDPQSMLSSMENSMWGDLMSEALKEEDDRSISRLR